MNKMQENISKLTSDLQSIYEDLEQERVRTNLILSAISEGVFLLDRKFCIQEGYSANLKDLLNHPDLGGRDFFSLLENRIPEDNIRSTQEYLEFLFRDDLDEETLRELNPLSKIEFHYEDQSGLWLSSRFLSFLFKRVVQDDKIESIICTVKDISSEEELTKKLEESERYNKKQIEWLVNILHVKPILLQEFVKVVEDELKEIDDALKNPIDFGGYNSVLNIIVRAIHRIKRNSAILDLNFIKDQAVRFKDELDQIQKKKEVSGSDFVPIVVRLGDIRMMMQEIHTLMSRVKHFKNSLRTTRKYEDGLITSTISELIEELCIETKKKVNFKYEDFNSEEIPFQHQQIVKEFLVILTKFTILHSIETPEQRRAANHNPEATIELETFNDDINFGFKFRHDGRLIRIERMLQKVIDARDAAIDEEDSIDEKSQLGSEVLQLFFTPTSNPMHIGDLNDTDGILQDMQMVKKKLTLHGGRSKITFTSEEYCEYTITLPKK